MDWLFICLHLCRLLPSDPWCKQINHVFFDESGGTWVPTEILFKAKKTKLHQTKREEMGREEKSRGKLRNLERQKEKNTRTNYKSC